MSLLWSFRFGVVAINFPPSYHSPFAPRSPPTDARFCVFFIRPSIDSRRFAVSNSFFKKMKKVLGVQNVVFATLRRGLLPGDPRRGKVLAGRSTPGKSCRGTPGRGSIAQTQTGPQ